MLNNSRNAGVVMKLLPKKVATCTASLFPLSLTHYLWNMNISPTRRFRRAVGSLDSDSDEDPEIDVSAVSTSHAISITHYAFPSKRQMNPADEQVAKSSPSAASNILPEATADDDQTPGEAKPIEEKERNQVRLSWYFEVAE